MTLLNFFFGQSRLWKFLHGLVAVPVETVRFERSVHLFDCNTSWVKLNIVSLYKPVSLSKGPGKRGHIVADTLLPTKCYPVCPRAQHLICVRDPKMFLILLRNILCPQQMVPSLRSPRNIMGNNVSAPMCPRWPGP